MSTSKQHRVEWTLKVGTEGGQEVTALKAELDKLGRIDAFAKLKKQTEDAEKEWRSATSRVAAMARVLSSVEKPTKKMVQEFDRARAQAGRLKDQFEGQRLTLHNLRGELGQAGINTTKLASAQLQARTRVAALQAALQAGNTEMGKTKVAAGSATVGLDGLRGGVGGVQAALAGLVRMFPGGLAGIFAGITAGATGKKAFDAAKMAAEYETMGVAMYVVGRNAGYARRELDEVEKSLRKTGISMQESRANIAKLIAANIDLKNATVLARIAQDTAVIARTNSSEAFGRLVDGIQSAQVETLRSLGINVNFEQSYRDLEKQLGRSKGGLNELEKMQARLNITVRTAAGTAGTYEESLETVGKKISSLSRLEQDSATNIGKLFTPILTLGADLYTAALQRVNKEVERLSSGDFEPGFLTSMIPALNKYREILAVRFMSEKAAAASAAEADEASAARRMAINNELTAVKKQNLESVLEKAKDTLKEAEEAEKKYAEEVKKYQEMADQARLSTQERVRGLLRTQMSDFDAYRDKQREAEESLAKAKEALSGGDTETGGTWAKKALEQFAQLNSEVKTGEVVLVSAAEANRIAVEGVLAAGKALEESHLNRMRATEEQRLAETETFQQAKTDIEAIEEAMSRIQDLEIEAQVKDQATPVLESIQKELAQIKDKTITIKVKYDEGPKPKGLAAGGRVPGFAFGGRLPGYSLKDNMLGMIRGRTPIALAGGEDVTNAFSSRVIYRDAPWLLPALNQVRSSIDLQAVLQKIKGLADGGRVPRARVDLSGLQGSMRGLASGGRVAESYRFTFASAGQEATVTTANRSEAEGLKALAKAMTKLKLVHGG